MFVVGCMGLFATSAHYIQIWIFIWISAKFCRKMLQNDEKCHYKHISSIFRKFHKVTFMYVMGCMGKFATSVHYVQILTFICISAKFCRKMLQNDEKCHYKHISSVFRKFQKDTFVFAAGCMGDLYRCYFWYKLLVYFTWNVWSAICEIFQVFLFASTKIWNNFPFNLFKHA